ncbi:MAG: hypothetical protein AAF228_07450 [Pseudomonadota bacterium]
MKDKELAQSNMIKRLMWGLLVLAVLSVVADFFVYHKSHFGIDGTPGFGAWYAFLSCVLFAVIAVLLGIILKQPETYYDD